MILLRIPKPKVDDVAEHIEHSLRHMGKAMIAIDEMQKESQEEEVDEAMLEYIKHNGWHFNAKACTLAVDNMKRLNPTTSKLEKITPWSKSEVDALLAKHGVTLKHSHLYDYVYVANMAQADYFKSSIADEAHLALYVKDTVDDVDGSPERHFRTWVQTCESMGWEIPWIDLL